MKGKVKIEVQVDHSAIWLLGNDSAARVNVTPNLLASTLASLIKVHDWSGKVTAHETVVGPAISTLVVRRTKAYFKLAEKLAEWIEGLQKEAE